MSRTDIDLDDDACAEVMRRYHLATERDTVNLALRLAATDALSTEQAHDLRGSGWDAELEELRTTRVP